MAKRDKNGQFAVGGAGGPGRPPKHRPITADRDAVIDDLIVRTERLLEEFPRAADDLAAADLLRRAGAMSSELDRFFERQDADD